MLFLLTLRNRGLLEQLTLDEFPDWASFESKLLNVAQIETGRFNYSDQHGSVNFGNQIPYQSKDQRNQSRSPARKGDFKDKVARNPKGSQSPRREWRPKSPNSKPDAKKGSSRKPSPNGQANLSLVKRKLII